jgi:hypothetical protein
MCIICMYVVILCSVGVLYISMHLCALVNIDTISMNVLLTSTYPFGDFVIAWYDGR